MKTLGPYSRSGYISPQLDIPGLFFCIARCYDVIISRNKIKRLTKGRVNARAGSGFIISFGSQVAAKEGREYNIPLVFSVVLDPLGAGIVDRLDAPFSRIT